MRRDKSLQTAGNYRSRYGETFKFIKNAKLPWGHYILSSIVPFAVTIIYIYLPTLEGEIAAGNIFDETLVRNYILLSLALVVFSMVSFYSAWTEIQFDRRIQRQTWTKLIRMPMSVYDVNQPSTLISRITDDSTCVSSFVSYFFSALISVYSAVMVMLSLFQMNVTLALFTVPVILLNTIFVFVLRNRGYDVGYSIQEALSRYTCFISERVSQIPLVKAMGTEDEELIQGELLSEERRSAEMRSMKYEIFISIIMEVTNILIVGFVLIGGAMLINNGSMNIETLVAFYILAMTLPNHTQEMLFQVTKAEQFRGALEVISELANMDVAESGGELQSPPLADGISFRDVSFSYGEGERTILDHVNFTIPKGKTTAIIGPTGSGKTSILRLIERFYDVDSGEILYDGRSIDEFDIASWRQRIGYIVQNSPLISGSIRSNITYGAKRELSDDEVMELVRAVKLDDFVASLPGGLDAEIDGNGDNISGGQRQRIAIARALAAEPDILIMDEATSNLDAVNVKEISDSIKELARDKTVIVVAHQMNTIRDADQIIVLADGHVRACGDHGSLAASDEYYREYCNLQGLRI